MTDAIFPSRIAALPDLAVLQFHGPDATAFLQGQLSNDIANMPSTEARLACYCSAKGRVLATLVVWREPSDTNEVCYALVKADIADALCKRLSMFVLRAKVVIQVVARAVAGQVVAQGTVSPWAVTHDAGHVYIQAPGADPAQCRHWHIRPADTTDAVVHATGADTRAWHAADIAAGLPWISAANQDLYIPQTLNLDLLGAISFTKGCYPGQEVVARSHYRGTLKRRMAYGTAAAHAQVAIGMDVFRTRAPENPCGRVINLAQAEGLWHMLLEVQLADLPEADFRLDDDSCATIRLCPLPYALINAA